MLCSELNGKEIWKRGDICMCIADLLYSIAEKLAQQSKATVLQ